MSQVIFDISFNKPIPLPEYHLQTQEKDRLNATVTAFTYELCSAWLFLLFTNTAMPEGIDLTWNQGEWDHTQSGPEGKSASVHYIRSPGICLPPLLPVCSDIYFRIFGLDGMSLCSQGGLRGCHQNWHWRCCNKWLLITNSLFTVNLSFSFIFINIYGRMSVLLRIVI